jgi:hypothetical protein
VGAELVIHVMRPGNIRGSVPEPIATSDAKLGRRCRGWERLERHCLVQRSVGPVLVEMRRVLGQYVFEMAPVEDQLAQLARTLDLAGPADTAAVAVSRLLGTLRGRERWGCCVLERRCRWWIGCFMMMTRSGG